MIRGIGCDLLKMSNIPDASLQRFDAFYEKVYTAAEKRQADGSDSRQDWLRRRFAAKEAVFKALGEDPDRARISEIEILDDDYGAPHVTLHGMLGRHAREVNICKVHISISSDGEYAIAYAAAETSDRNERNEEIL